MQLFAANAHLRPISLFLLTPACRLLVMMISEKMICAATNFGLFDRIQFKDHSTQLLDSFYLNHRLLERALLQTTTAKAIQSSTVLQSELPISRRNSILKQTVLDKEQQQSHLLYSTQQKYRQLSIPLRLCFSCATKEKH